MWEELYQEFSRQPSFVPPHYPTFTSPQVVVVGEMPEKADTLSKQPFTSQSGKLLRACLLQAGYSVNTLHMTYTIKEIGEAGQFVREPRSRRQSPEWLSSAPKYLHLLNRELKESSAQLILAIGNIALCALTGRWGIYKWRGSPLRSIHSLGDKWVFPILSTDATIRGASEEKFLIMQDLQKALGFMKAGGKLKERTYATRPTFDASIEFLDSCLAAGLQGATVAFDIEIKNQELNCISFAINSESAISIAFVDESGDVFSPPQEAAIMKRIARILSSKSIRKVGQNLVFDTNFLLHRYGIRTHNLDDTMIAQHTLFPQIAKGLDMVTSLWTDIPYYKDDGKDWIKGGGTYSKLWVYNCLDSIVCQEAFPKLHRQLGKADNLDAYYRQLSIVEPCCYMMERGIRVDLGAMKEARAEMEREVVIAQKRLSSIAPGLNPNSPKQMQDYFYGQLKIPPYKNKQHKVSVDTEALKRIAKKKGTGSLEASLILDIKKKAKLISTYLQDDKFDADSRIRCSYNPVGTTYSRLSSSKSIFGGGMNMQNWPHELLRFLKPDLGYVCYTMDLSQAENRIVAYVGRIDSMIDAFETGKDVHRLTASLIFGKPPEEISDEPGSCSLGNGESTERQWGKKANHGLNYDLGFRSFAILYDLPERDAKFIVDKYHAAYPELRANFHGHIKKSLAQSRTVTNLMGRKTIFLTDLVDSTYKAAYSCIPQGTVGDIMNERGMAYIYYNPSLFGPVELLQQVHDSITFQIPLPPVVSWEQHAYMLDAIKRKLETPLTTHYGRTFVIPVDTVMGLNFRKEEGAELKSKKWPGDLPSLARLLEESYNKLKGRGDGAA